MPHAPPHTGQAILPSGNLMLVLFFGTNAIAEVNLWTDSRGVARQCRNPRGFGPRGLYCKQHKARKKQGFPVRVPKTRKP